VIAGKPGFTNAAQHTLVEYLKKDNKEIISVVMKTNKKSKYKDVQTMASYSFAHMVQAHHR
jgi:D-alanyl-D-alanine carboxypeptidase